MAQTKKPKPTAVYQYISPQMAEEWIKLNTRNRAITMSRVRDFAEIMRRGEWDVTHQGVAFGDDGSLYDGQHRLMAIIESGCTVEMLVTRGLSPKSRANIDTGGRRSATDNLNIIEGVSLSKTMGSSIGAVWMATVAKSVTRPATAAELAATLTQHLDGYEAMRTVFNSSRRGLCRSGFIGAFIYAYPTDPVKVLAAAQKFWSGAELAENDPMYVLRNRALNGASNGRSREKDHGRGATVDDFRRSLGAIASFIDGEKRSRVISRSSVAINDSDAYQRFAKAHEKSASK